MYISLWLDAILLRVIHLDFGFCSFFLDPVYLSGPTWWTPVPPIAPLLDLPGCSPLNFWSATTPLFCFCKLPGSLAWSSAHVVFEKYKNRKISLADRDLCTWQLPRLSRTSAATYRKCTCRCSIAQEKKTLISYTKHARLDGHLIEIHISSSLLFYFLVMEDGGGDGFLSAVTGVWYMCAICVSSLMGARPFYELSCFLEAGSLWFNRANLFLFFDCAESSSTVVLF